MSRLDRREVERLLPQKGAMCLIDAVLERGGETIVCIADAARADNPLRDDHGVSVVHSVEYGAQAAALHRLTLTADHGTATGGLLLQVRDVHFFSEYLDRLPQPLTVSARCAAASSQASRYRFEIRTLDFIVSSGELTLKLT